jgi:hypothetical protein
MEKIIIVTVINFDPNFFYQGPLQNYFFRQFLILLLK